MSITLRGVTLTDDQETIAKELEKAVREYPYTAAAMIVHLSGGARETKWSRYCCHCGAPLIDNYCPRCDL